jgi:ATP adenylyltransferase
VTDLEILWNGWRNNYVRTAPAGGSGSVFTRLISSGEPDAATYIVHRSETCFAVLNIYPYSTGHLLVVPYREVAAIDELEPIELIDLWTVVNNGVTALRSSHQPEGFNIGINMGKPAGGSVAEHLHVHVVPRWTGDSNFMTAIAQSRTIPEALDVTYDRIKHEWPAADLGIG